MTNGDSLWLGELVGVGFIFPGDVFGLVFSTGVTGRGPLWILLEPSILEK